MNAKSYCTGSVEMQTRRRDKACFPSKPISAIQKRKRKTKAEMKAEERGEAQEKFLLFLKEEDQKIDNASVGDKLGSTPVAPH